MHTKKTYNTGYVYFITAVAAFGGLLFGYDTGVISGAQVGFAQEFDIEPGEGQTLFDSIKSGWAVSCAFIGAIIGVLTVGPLADSYGRKKILFVAAALLLISSVASYFPRTLNELVLARMIGGFGLGIASMLSPMYIAEIAPQEIRGRLVALNQLALIVGMLITGIVNYYFQGVMGSALEGWRSMLAAEAVPSFLFLVLLFFIPESPRWLLSVGRKEEANVVLSKIGNDSYAKEHLREIQKHEEEQKAQITRTELLKNSGLKRAVFIGFFLVLIVQFSGINAVMYYTGNILQNLGATEGKAFLQMIIIGGVNVFFSILAVLFIDKIGRKLILLIALGGMTVFLVVLGASASLSGSVTFICLIAYVACFMFGLGPGHWALVSEIYPTKLRALGLGGAALATWGGVFIVSQTFPMLRNAMGENVFWLYGGISLLGFFFVSKFVFETKGKTLEEIEEIWMRQK